MDKIQEIKKYQLAFGTLSLGDSVPKAMCEVNKISVKNCTTSRNFDELEMNDVLENIRILLNYIKKMKKRTESFCERRGNTA